MAAAIIPLVMGAIGTGAQAYSAKKGADAAKDAAAAQAQAGRESLALQKQMYEQGRADLQPWMTQGANAVNTMGSLMGLGGGAPAAAAAAPSPPAEPATMATMGRPPFVQVGQQAGHMAALARQHPELGTPHAFQVGRTAATLAQLNPTSTAAQGQSSYARMQAPDGSVENVPSQYVDYFRQRGASVIG